MRAYRTHPTMRATACLIPTAAHPLSRGRELERGQQAARLVFGRLGCWERLPKFGECPLPSPPPRGREQVSADSSVEDRLKKNARNINSRNFSGSLYRDRWNKRRKSFFRRPLNPSGRVCAARHAYGGLGLQGKWRTRAYRTHPTYRLIACYLNTLEEKRIWTSFHLKFAKPLHITFTA